MKHNIRKNVSSPNKLWEEDERLFSLMENEAVSDEEREFFEVQHYKQLYNFTCANDLVMSELSNTDQLYIVRVNFDEYIFGVATRPENEVHVMNLSEALNTNLKETKLLDHDITLLGWLRERGYEGVEYQHNFDDTIDG